MNKQLNILEGKTEKLQRTNKLTKAEKKAKKKAEKARKRAVRSVTDKFIQDVLQNQQPAVFNRKVLRNLLRRFVGNKRMQPVMEELQQHYKISLEG